MPWSADPPAEAAAGRFITKDTKEGTKDTKGASFPSAGVTNLRRCGFFRAEGPIWTPGPAIPFTGMRSGPFVSFVPSFVSFVMNLRLSGPLPSL